MRIYHYLKKYFNLPPRLWLLMILGALFYIIRAWEPLERLLPQTADDAYYYLNIARNIVHGRGISFDGLYLTNGFHPLYLIFLIPIFLFSPDTTELNLHLALTLLSLFYISTSITLFHMVKMSINESSAYLAVIAWLFNPWGMVIVMNGVESAVYMFFLSLSAFLFILYQRTANTPEGKPIAILIGLFSGVTYLARSDGIFFILVITIFWVIRFFDFSWRKNLRMNLEHFAYYCVSLLIPLTPWFIWNLYHWGTITQISGTAIFFHSHEFISTINEFLIVISRSFKDAIYTTLTLNILSIAFIFSIKTARFFRQFRKVDYRLSSFRIHKSALLIFAVYLCLLLSFYSLFLWHFQIWYFMPTIFFFPILLAKTISKAKERWKPLKLKKVFYIENVVMMFFFISFLAYNIGIYPSTGIGYYPASKNGVILANWINQNTSTNARIGAWNSGVIGYFSQRPVINLDGVVNNELFDFLQDRDASYYDTGVIIEYLYENNIEYLTDIEIIDDYISGVSDRNFSLVYEYPSAQDRSKKITIFKIESEQP